MSKKETVKPDLGMYEFKIHGHNSTEKKPVFIKNSLQIQNIESEFIPSIDEKYKFNFIAHDVVEDIKENQRVILVGHTGCGKTSLIEQLAARINQPVSRVNLNGQLTIGDFVGMWTVKAGETVWVDGVLPKAMKDGYWLILDELDFGDTGILSILNPVLEKNGKLTLKEKGHEVIVPHPNFRIFATANTIGCMQAFRHLYQGTNLMNEAFLDRFRVYLVDYMKMDQERDLMFNIFKEKYSKKILGDEKLKLKNFTKAEKDLNTLMNKMVTVANVTREAFQKGELQDCTFSTRRLIDWVEMTVRHENPLKAANSCIFSKISEYNKATILGYMKRDLPTDEQISNLFAKLQGESVMTIDEEKEALVEIVNNTRRKYYTDKGLGEKEIEDKLNEKEANEGREHLVNTFVGLALDIRKLNDSKEIRFNFTPELLIAFFEKNMELNAKKVSAEKVPYQAATEIIKPLVTDDDYIEILGYIKKRLGKKTE